MNLSGLTQAGKANYTNHMTTAHGQRSNPPPQWQAAPEKGSVALARNSGDYPGMWKEFFSGMHMLHQYFARTRADMSAIAAANIRLLHNNLQITPGYRQILKSAKQHRDDQTMLTHWPLINDPKLYGSIIGLNNSGHELSPHNLVSQICYDDFNTDAVLGTEEPVFSFYLVIAGKLAVGRGKVTPTCPDHNLLHFNRHPKKPNEVIYKPGDVLVNPQHQGDISSIQTKHKNTLLLGVHLAFG